MKSVISFDVKGQTLDELKAKALETFRKLLANPEAELPFSATIEVNPDVVIEAQDGTKVAETWIGTVTVTLAADGGSR